ncbi:hypothetical protein JYU34_001051 [Plutella xylostella]|uniref:Uncharacterized protein n=1 Tax=Plutella xylostella TaxID=51655 RepID=A0ABQ7R5W1_PLUXY|nr:hypothetical protein JYU34_001051 [Plutella xylostella]
MKSKNSHKTCDSSSCPAPNNPQNTLEAELLEVEKELVAAEEELWRLDKMRKDAELTSEAGEDIHNTKNMDTTRPFVVKSCFDEVLKDLINKDCKTNIQKIRNLPNPICNECEKTNHAEEDEVDDDSTCGNFDCQSKQKSNYSTGNKRSKQAPTKSRDSTHKENIEIEDEVCPTVKQLNKSCKIKESRENYKISPDDLLKFACPCKPPNIGKALIIPNTSNKHKTPQILPKRTTRRIERCPPPRKRLNKLKSRENSINRVKPSENKCMITDCKKDEDPCLEFNQKVLGVDKETCCTWTPETPEISKAEIFYKNKEDQLEDIILDLKDYIKQNTKKILKTFDKGVIKSYSEGYLPCDDACACDCQEQQFFEIKSYMDEDKLDDKKEEDCTCDNIKNNLMNIKKLKESVERFKKDESMRKHPDSNKYVQCTECLNEDVQTNNSREVLKTNTSIEKSYQEEDYQCNKCWKKDLGEFPNKSKDKIKSSKTSTERVNNDEIYECIECLIEDLQSIKGKREEDLAKNINLDNNKSEDKKVKIEALDTVKIGKTVPIPADDTYNCNECWEKGVKMNTSKIESSRTLNLPDKTTEVIKKDVLNDKPKKESEYLECTRCSKEETREVAKINDANIRKSLAAKNDKGYECTECLIEDLEHTIKNLKDYVQLAKSLQRVKTNQDSNNQYKVNDSQDMNAKDDELYECLQCYDKDSKTYPEPNVESLAKKETSQNITKRAEDINDKVDFEDKTAIDNKHEKIAHLAPEVDSEYICSKCSEEHPQYLQEPSMQSKLTPNELPQKHKEPSIPDTNNLPAPEVDSEYICSKCSEEHPQYLQEPSMQSKLTPNELPQKHKEPSIPDTNNLRNNEPLSEYKHEVIKENEKEYVCSKCPFDDPQTEKVQKANNIQKIRAPEEIDFTCKECMEDLVAIEELRQAVLANREAKAAEQANNNSTAFGYIECGVCKAKVPDIKNKLLEPEKEKKTITIEENNKCRYKNECNLCAKDYITPPPSQYKNKISNEYGQCEKLCVQEHVPNLSTNKIKENEYHHGECKKICMSEDGQIGSVKTEQEEKSFVNEEKLQLPAQNKVKDEEYDYSECKSQCKDVITIKKNPKDVIKDEKGSKKSQRKRKIKDNEEILVCTKCSNNEENNTILPIDSKAISSTSTGLKSSQCKVKNECNECTVEDIKVINIKDEIQKESQNSACPECATDNQLTQSTHPVASSGKDINKKPPEYDFYECNDCFDTVKVKKGSSTLNKYEINNNREETVQNAAKNDDNEHDIGTKNIEINHEKKTDKSCEYKIDNTSKSSGYIDECDGCLTEEALSNADPTTNNTVYEYFECDKCNEIVQVKKESDKPNASHNSAKNDKVPKRSAAGVKRTSDGKEVFICSSCAEKDECRSNENVECLTCLTSGVRCRQIYRNAINTDPILSRSCRDTKNIKSETKVAKMCPSCGSFLLPKRDINLLKNSEVQNQRRGLKSGANRHASETKYDKKCLGCSITITTKTDTRSVKNCQIPKDIGSTAKEYHKKCLVCGSTLVPKKDTSQIKSCHTIKNNNFSSEAKTSTISRDYEKKCLVCGSKLVRKMDKSRIKNLPNDTRSIQSVSGTSIRNYDKKCSVCGKKMMNEKGNVNDSNEKPKSDDQLTNYSNPSYVDSTADKVNESSNITESNVSNNKGTDKDSYNDTPEKRENTGKIAFNVQNSGETITSPRSKNANSDGNTKDKDQEEDTYSIASEYVRDKNDERSSKQSNIQDYKERREWKRK